MKLVLLGAPGSGKGTQAKKICDHFHIPHIAIGDIMRLALKNNTEMGEKARPYVESGKLVPDDIVIAIVKERLNDLDCRNGFVLDGFPRTILQAEAFDSMNIDVDKVININVEDSQIAERMSGRRICPICGASFHTKYSPPALDDICDLCGAALIQRKDDKLEVVQKRLDIYHEQTEPLIAFYQKKGKLVCVDGSLEIDEVFDNIIKVLSSE